MNTFKFLSVVVLFLLSLAAVSKDARAWGEGNITFVVEVDGTTLTSGTTILDLERGNTFEVRVEVTSNVNVSDAQIEASLAGIHNEDVEDTTGTFDLESGVTYVKRLTLELPDRMDQDTYNLRVRLEDRGEGQAQSEYDLKVDTARNYLTVKDVVLSPGDEVRQGRALLATVRVKNLGEKDEEGVKITFSVPSLGLSASDYIDEIESGDSMTSEELYVKVPNCADLGSHTYEVEVEYDDGDESVTETGSVYVTEGDVCELSEDAAPTTLVTVGPATQDVAQGASAIYPVTLSNSGSEAKSYTVSVDGTSEWATSSLDPASSVVLQSGESKAVYVYVSANEDATAGEHMFTLSITSGTETLKQVALKANVLEDGKTDFKRGLEVALIVLVILLVVLGLIVGFNKLRGEEEEDDNTGETYY